MLKLHGSSASLVFSGIRAPDVGSLVRSTKALVGVTVASALVLSAASTWAADDRKKSKISIGVKNHNDRNDHAQ